MYSVELVCPTIPCCKISKVCNKPFSIHGWYIEIGWRPSLLPKNANALHETRTHCIAIIALFEKIPAPQLYIDVKLFLYIHTLYYA